MYKLENKTYFEKKEIKFKKEEEKASSYYYFCPNSLYFANCESSFVSPSYIVISTLFTFLNLIYFSSKYVSFIIYTLLF